MWVQQLTRMTTVMIFCAFNNVSNCSASFDSILYLAIMNHRAAEIGVRAFVRTPNDYKKKSSYKVFLKYVRWRTSRWTSKSSLRIPCVHVQNQYLSTLLSIQIDCHLFVVAVSFSGPIRRSIGPGQTANLLYKLYYFLRFCGKCVQVNIFFEHVF